MCQSLFFNKVAGLRPATLLKQEALEEVFPCELCEISNNTFFAEHLWWLLLNIFDHLFLYAAYADDAMFFLENKESIEKLVKTFTLFPSFLGLKPNISKCIISGLGPLKGVERAVCGMQSVDITREAIKILRIYF